MDEDLRKAERVERDGLLEAFAAAPADVAATLGLAHSRFNGMGAIAAAAVPVTDFNRITAVGVEAPASADDLSAALNWLEECRSSNWAFQVSPPAETPGLAAWLAEQRLAPSGNGWAKFVLSRPAPASSDAHPGNVVVRRVDATDADTFGHVMQVGFGAPDATRPWFTALGRLPTWRGYLAFVGQEPAGVGSMYIAGDTAWLNSAATLPAHRGRGVQAALIAHRIADAVSDDVTLLTAETGFPTDGKGETFPSYRNYIRAGFKLAYVRANYRPA